jgi:hypothetical protein
VVVVVTVIVLAACAGWATGTANKVDNKQAISMEFICLERIFMMFPF